MSRVRVAAVLAVLLAAGTTAVGAVLAGMACPQDCSHDS